MDTIHSLEPQSAVLGGPSGDGSRLRATAPTVPHSAPAFGEHTGQTMVGQAVHHCLPTTANGTFPTFNSPYTAYCPAQQPDNFFYSMQTSNLHGPAAAGRLSWGQHAQHQLQGTSSASFGPPGTPGSQGLNGLHPNGLDSTRTLTGQNSGLNASAPEFLPTTLALYGPGYQREPTAAEQLLRDYSGMSANYKGNPANPLNHSVVGLPHSQNCSFWIDHLPKNVAGAHIFGAIRGCGRVYALHVNRDLSDTKYTHAGAKLVFFTVVDAHEFFTRHVIGPLVIEGSLVRVRRNRIKVQEQRLPEYKTRCVRVSGPSHLVNRNSLHVYLGARIRFETEDIIVHRTRPYASIEFRFAAYRGQAALALKALRMRPDFIQSDVKVIFVPDPCDRGYAGSDK